MEALWESMMDAPDYSQDSPWFPNPVICARDMAATGYKEFTERLPWNGLGAWLNETWYWMSRIQYKEPDVILMPLLLATLMTLLRIFLNWALFTRIPKWYKLNAEASEKFPESVWKVMVYAVTWTWAMYLLTTAKVNTFFHPEVKWFNWIPTVQLEPGQYWLYMTQMGFYLHCSYATMYLETIRRDFAVLMTHHVLTLGLLLFSYVIRFHLIGLMLLAILDIGDILLETSKCMVYFKDRGNKKNPKTEMMANICFAAFTLQHMVCRLYWFPTKVIYSAMHVGPKTFPGGPYVLLFIPMLWALYAMQVYWFKFIVKLLWKIFVLGQDLEDTREYLEEEEEAEMKKKKE